MRLNCWVHHGRCDTRRLRHSIVSQTQVSLLAIADSAFFFLRTPLCLRTVASISRFKGSRLWLPWLWLCIQSKNYSKHKRVQAKLKENKGKVRKGKEKKKKKAYSKVLWSLLMLKQTSSSVTAPKTYCLKFIPQVHTVAVATNRQARVVSIGNLFLITKFDL